MLKHVLRAAPFIGLGSLMILVSRQDAIVYGLYSVGAGCAYLFIVSLVRKESHDAPSPRTGSQQAGH